MKLSVISVLLLLLSSCGARWQSMELSTVPAGQVEAHDFSGVGRAHGHRDFPDSFDTVWQVTVETLHARGIGVPRSAAPDGRTAHLDLKDLHILVEERFSGRVCVLVRFRELGEDRGVQQARGLLDEIMGRL
jgi:hypothetical protein